MAEGPHTPRKILDLAEVNGWAVVQMQIEQFLAALAESSGDAGALTSQGVRVEVLRPRDQAEARARTLSAMSGLGPQPLHTDGAHLRVPPTHLLLQAEVASSTPTRVVRLDTERHSALARRAVFRVRNGGRTFFRAAFGDYGFRYDPGCMFPVNADAHEFCELIAHVSESASEVHWTAGDQLLIVNNRLSLHGRSVVGSGDKGRAMRRATLFQTRRGAMNV